MNNFIANFNITDTICGKCCKETYQKNVSISDTSQSISLKNGYYLNVISCNQNFCTVIIQNGSYSVIRLIFTNHDTRICLPCKCAEHLITIGVVITSNS